MAPAQGNHSGGGGGEGGGTGTPTGTGGKGLDHHGVASQYPWGAKNSLRRVADRNKLRGHEEATPLLAGGRDDDHSGYGDARERGRAAHEWEGQADYEGLTWWHRPSMYWLLPPFFLFALAGGGIIVPRLNLILQLVCREYFIEKSAANTRTAFAPVLLANENPQCRIPEVQALATKFSLYMTVITGALSAVMSPKLGAWSDQHGRLKCLVVTSAGAFIGEIIVILAASYPGTFSYHWILLGSVFDGLCGSFNAGMALTHAYASDCTAPPKRAVAFGYFHACLFAGIACGPLIAAYMIKQTASIITPFYFALAIHTAFIAFLLFVVPESLTKKRQELVRERHAAESSPLLSTDAHAHPNEFKSTIFAIARQLNILSPLKILWPTGTGTSGKLRANLILLSLVDTVVFGVAMGGVTVTVYYLGFQFLWETPEIAVFTSIVNICRVSALLILLPLLNYLVRTRRANRERRESGFAVAEPNTGSDSLDLFIIRGALVAELVGFILYSVARRPGVFVLGGVIASLGGVGSPTLQSALTKHVPHDRVGQLLGATGLLHALARVVCPLVFDLIYAVTVGTFPQAVFVVLTGCFVVAAVCSWFIRPNIYLEDPVEHNVIQSQLPVVNNPEVLVDEELTGI